METTQERIGGKIVGYTIAMMDCIHCGGIQTMEEYFDYNNNEYIYDCSQCGYHNHLIESKELVKKNG
jgi:transcription elongation factor Elf1